MMQGLVLEKIINLAIQNSNASLKALNNKTVNFNVTNLNINICCHINNDRVFVVDNTLAKVDVDVSFNSAVLLDLFKKVAIADLLREDKIIIHGELKVVQLLLDLLKSIDFDIEEILSKFGGDIFANGAVRVVNKIRKTPLDTIKDKIINTIIMPVKSTTFTHKRG